MQEPLTREHYFGARMISDPLCLYDFCLECDGAVAVVITSAERAQDLRHPPVLSSRHRPTAGTGAGARRSRGWACPTTTSRRPVTGRWRTRLYEMAGVGPDDVDVALLYDHFTPMVIMQLEDYGFCGVGEGGPFVADGNIRWPDGGLPVNTHGGNLSEAYIIGHDAREGSRRAAAGHRREPGRGRRGRARAPAGRRRSPPAA